LSQCSGFSFGRGSPLPTIPSATSSCLRIDALPILSSAVAAVIGIGMAMRGPSGGNGLSNRRRDVGSEGCCAGFGSVLDGIIGGGGGGGGGGGFGAVIDFSGGGGGGGGGGGAALGGCTDRGDGEITCLMSGVEPAEKRVCGGVRRDRAGGGVSAVMATTGGKQSLVRLGRLRRDAVVVVGGLDAVASLHVSSPPERWRGV